MRTEHEWVREVPVEVWLTDQRSHSYIGLADGEVVMVELDHILRAELGAGPVRCRYETWLWQAVRR